MRLPMQWLPIKWGIRRNSLEMFLFIGSVRNVKGPEFIGGSIGAQISLLILRRAQTGSVKDFTLFVTADHKKGERMAKILRGEPSEVPEAFRRSVNRLSFGGRVLMSVVNRFVEMLKRDHADIRNLSIDHTQRHATIIEGWCRDPIEENICDIFKAEVPHIRRCVRGVHCMVDGTFDILPATFGVILMLVVRFTLPVRNDKGKKDIMGAFANLLSTMVARLMSLSMAPRLQIEMSLRVLTNSFGLVCMGKISITWD